MKCRCCNCGFVFQKPAESRVACPECKSTAMETLHAVKPSEEKATDDGPGPRYLTEVPTGVSNLME